MTACPHCAKAAVSRGLCESHYRRWLRHGDPLYKRPSAPKKTCLYDGRPAVKRGMCDTHYQRWRIHGDPLHEAPRVEGKCIVTDDDARCDRDAINLRGLCGLHDSRLRRNGVVGPVKPTVEVVKNRCTVTDEKSRCAKAVYSGGLCQMHHTRQKRTGEIGPVAPKIRAAGEGSYSRGYKTVTFKGRVIREHRLIMEQQIGRPLRDDEIVHHRNGRKDDNRPENLEVWSGGHPRGRPLADLLRGLAADEPLAFTRAIAALRNELHPRA